MTDATAVGACAHCGHAPLRPFGMAEDARRAVHVAQWECSSCRLLISYPRRSDESLARYYAHEYYGRIWTDPDAVWRQNLIAYATELRLLDRFSEGRRPRGRVLDVGCGYGVMLHLLKQRGYDAYGCESGVPAAAFCRRRGLNILRAVAPQLPFRANSFQLVVSLHVVEHVTHPQAFVSALVRVLEPGGMLVLVTDHRWTAEYAFKRALRRLRGHIPPFYTSTDHTFIYTRQHLATMMADAGCEQIRAAAFTRRPDGESLHWRAYKGIFRLVDRLCGWGDYMMVTAVKRSPDQMA